MLILSFLSWCIPFQAVSVKTNIQHGTYSIMEGPNALSWFGQSGAKGTPNSEQIFLYSVVKTSVSFDPLDATIGASSNRKYIQELFYDL